ncbi:hypothetical protein GGU10DRAFT_380158 [Lentinula aff. detonsa]|uniref:Uncharacterized protein n=1 Tax=Lentinula aff. detonsa TaxID=2804958 RepID=A0AA38KWS4_9AGAR|nr:hypothetical protein GGU10DRAFT_380158 [Lentinula aff. detonsa]
MSTTSSPVRPAHSPSPILNEEEAELQAYLAAAHREAQEKWRRLREEKALENVADEREIVEEKEVEGKEIEDVVEVKKEVAPKVEPRPRKVAIKMVVGMPRSREVILIRIPFPSPSPMPANIAFVVIRSAGLNHTLPTQWLPRARSPPSEAETTGMKEEMRELRFAVEELTGQVRALVRQGRRDREERGLRREDCKGKGRRREPTPETDRYSSE